MKLVTKFLTTDAAIYFYAGKFIVMTGGKIIFSSLSKEMCVGLALNKAELKFLESKVTEYCELLIVEKELIYT